MSMCKGESSQNFLYLTLSKKKKVKKTEDFIFLTVSLNIPCHEQHEVLFFL